MRHSAAPSTIAPPARSTPGVLAEGNKHPDGAEHNVEQADQPRLGRGNALGALHEQDEGEADRGQAEQEQHPEVEKAERRTGRQREPTSPSRTRRPR